MALTDITARVSPEPNSGCWLWTGPCTTAGYGMVTVGGNGRGVRPAGKRYYAHQYSWILHNGEIPEGKYILHKCDVRACVNPDHLFLGTQKDNIRDMDAKGRRVNAPRFCEGHTQAKLTNDQALAIRESKERGIDLASMYGVSPNAISRIRLGRNWKHLGDSLEPK